MFHALPTTKAKAHGPFETRFIPWPARMWCIDGKQYRRAELCELVTEWHLRETALPRVYYFESRNAGSVLVETQEQLVAAVLRDLDQMRRMEFDLLVWELFGAQSVTQPDQKRRSA